jgi:uncharacterized protein
MNAVEATLWTIGSVVAFSVALQLVQRAFPALRGDRGTNGLVQLLVYTGLIFLLRFFYFPATSARTVLGLRGAKWVYYPIALFLGAAIQFPASAIYEAILARWPDAMPATELAEVFSSLPLWRKVTAGIGLIVTTPLVEEAFFRGALFGTLWRRMSHVSVVIITAVLFALIHGQPQLFLPIGMVGAALAYLRLASGSMWPGVILHMAFNGEMFYAIATGATESPAANEPTPVLWVLGGTVVTAGCLALAVHFRQRDEQAAAPTSEDAP